MIAFMHDAWFANKPRSVSAGVADRAAFLEG